MKHSRTDTSPELSALPRPLYGQVDSHPNLIFPQRHRHSWAQLSYATQGYLQVWTPQACFSALPQRAVWIPAGMPHRVRRSSRTVIRSLYLDAPAFGLDWPDCRVLAISPLLHELIRHFSTLPPDYDQQGPEGRLAQVLIDQLLDSPEAGLILPWPADPRLQIICEQLQEHPNTPRGLAAFSMELGVSEKTLTRQFQRETGLGFRLWRQRARLVHALPLLERGDRITDVAMDCGYDSLSSFIAAFRAHNGVTPRAFAAGLRAAYQARDPVR